MWLEKYNEMSDSEKERFAKVACYLLNKNYLTRDLFEKNEKIAKINPDFRFAERFFDVLRDYFVVINFELKINNSYGFFYLENTHQYNKLRLDKLTTLILFALRSIFDEEKEKNSYGNVVYITMGGFIYKLLDMKIVNKKPTIKEIATSFRLLINQNVISKISGEVESSKSSYAILPTITHIVSNEKIDVMYSMLFEEEIKKEEEEEKQINPEDDILNSSLEVNNNEDIK